MRPLAPEFLPVRTLASVSLRLGDNSLIGKLAFGLEANKTLCEVAGKTNRSSVFQLQRSSDQGYSRNSFQTCSWPICIKGGLIGRDLNFQVRKPLPLIASGPGLNRP